MKKPKVLAYDLEFANSVPDGDWKRMRECGVSVCCSWSSEEVEPRVWIPEEGERVWKEFAVHALQHDVFLTWNGLSCDDVMIYEEFPLWEQVLGHGKRLDLAVVAGLFGIAEKKKLALDPISKVLAYGVPDEYPKLVGYKPRAHLNVKVGWTLEGTYCNTFGLPEAKSMDGAQAPIRWREGRRGEVIGYCVGDAKRLLDLYEHAWDGGFLTNKRKVKTGIPQEALAARPF
jgi:hypothetical protein